MSYFRETWKPRNTKCSSPTALSSVLDRQGMGALGKLPIELLIEVFKLVPFRPRLKAIMFVCKSFQGLIREKSLWKCVETDNALVGPTLAYMIQPAVGTTVEPLIPRANVEGVAVDMAYCTTGDVIGIIKRLQSQSHSFTSLSIRGTWPLLTATISNLSRQISRRQIRLSQLTSLKLSGSSSTCSIQTDDLAVFLASMPNLLHLTMDSDAATELQIGASLLHQISGAQRLKSLVAPLWVVPLSAASQLGSCFPELEVLELGLTVSKDTTTATAPVSALSRLRSAHLTCRLHCGGGSGSGDLAAVETHVSRFFVRFVGSAPRLRTLSFSARTSDEGGEKLDLFKCAGGGVSSLELQTVVLAGWAPAVAARVEEVWWCPRLVEAPWLWVDVGKQRRRQRRRVRRLRGRE